MITGGGAGPQDPDEVAKALEAELARKAEQLRREEEEAQKKSK